MLLTCHWSIWLLPPHEWMLALKGTLKWLKLWISLGICLAWISCVSHTKKSLVHKTYGCEITSFRKELLFHHTQTLAAPQWLDAKGINIQGRPKRRRKAHRPCSPGMSQSCSQAPLHCCGLCREWCEQAVWEGCRDHSVLRAVFPQETRDTC